MPQENTYGSMRLVIGEGSFKSTKAITILLAWLWRICSLNVKGVECICLKCSKSLPIIWQTAFILYMNAQSTFGLLLWLA